MFLNLEDEPQVAPLYSYQEMISNDLQMNEKDDGNKYKDIEDIFQRNQCFQKLHNYSRNSFATFFSDSYFQVVTTQLIPIFSQSSNDCFVDLLIPGFDHFKFSRIKEKLQKNSSFLFSWKMKKSQVIWRGSTHGTYWDNFISVPYWKGQRQRLVETIQQLNQSNHSLAKYFNVSFSKYSACIPTICNEMLQRYGTPSPVSYSEQLQYKYILDVDGVAWTGRFMPTLSYTTLILKSTYCREFFSPFILPYVHYIPIKTDYSDLTSQLEWILNHEKEVQQIISQANKISFNHLRYNDLKCYTSRMVLEYASLLQDTIPPDTM